MTTEQLTKEKEQTNQSLEKGEAEKVSTPEVQPSTKQTEDNKAYRSLQSSLDKLKAELVTLKGVKQSESRKKESLAEAQSWLDSGEATEVQVRKYSEAEDRLKTSIAEYISNVKEHETAVVEFEAKENRAILIEEAFALSDELLKDALVQMDDADSPKAKRLQAKQLKSDLQEKAVLALVENNTSLREKLIEALTGKEEKEVKRPDSGRTSTSGGKRSFTREEIGDRDFYLAHKDEILKAEKEGRIK